MHPYLVPIPLRLTHYTLHAWSRHSPLYSCCPSHPADMRNEANPNETGILCTRIAMATVVLSAMLPEEFAEPTAMPSAAGRAGRESATYSAERCVALIGVTSCRARRHGMVWHNAAQQHNRT
eukprot:362822-Chlamydomonas_euryale.AAC.23